MAKTKITARKSTGPHGVPRHQLAPRNHELGEGSSRTLGEEGSSSNSANIKNLNKELNTLRRAHDKDQEELAEMQRGITMTMELRNEAWTREDAANERVNELEFYVEDLEMAMPFYMRMSICCMLNCILLMGMVKLPMKK